MNSHELFSIIFTTDDELIISRPRGLTNAGLRELAKQLRDDIQVGLRVAHLTLQFFDRKGRRGRLRGWGYESGDTDVKNNIQQCKHSRWCI